MNKKATITIVAQRTRTEIISQRLVVYYCIMATFGVAIAILTAIMAGVQYAMPQAKLPSVLSSDASNSVTLSWTAPGDDGAVGQAAQYDIRYAAEPMTSENWSAATSVSNPPSPQTAGNSESTQITGLAPKTTYYFGLKTVDESGNWSALSNIASKTTACVEAWSWGEWSACVNGQQTRTVSDLNDCGTTINKPADTQTCVSEPVVCQENWTCADWYACADGHQQRTCTDQNNCGTVVNKPGESRTCEEPGDGQGGTETPLYQDTYIVTAPNAGAEPEIRVIDQNGKVISKFLAYEKSFRGGVNVAVGNLGADNIDEIIVGPGPGREPIVKIFTYGGRLINQFYAYPKTFTGGVNVAVGDIDGKPGGEIVTGPAFRGDPTIRIFGYRNSRFESVIGDFLAYDSKFRGGISVAVTDFENDGRAEVVVVPDERSGGPQVRVFRYEKGKMQSRTLGFMAYSSNFRGGVSFATGDYNGDGRGDLMTTPASNGGPHVRFFGLRRDGTLGLQNPGYFVFNDKFRGGVSVAAGDFDYNNKDEIVVAVRSGDVALVRIFQADGKKIIKEFKAYPDTMRSGIKLATGHFTEPK